ncbi:MAG: hypothetical protein ACD_2C00011G0001 [uncultured bacterium (gcode 4)]|uniref:Uncharacterized protein n=1 Tax=uncultured bacterium (gcode 4) TaxID=1234023 RepID=K2H361_9BACT|nr:MAG: hypothetical protein ACD_2C00011G0001 [uncultured bacterium (gcode 4)]
MGTYFFYMNKDSDSNQASDEKIYPIKNAMKLWDDTLLYNFEFIENFKYLPISAYWDNRRFENYENILTDKENEMNFRKIISTALVLKNINEPDYLISNTGELQNYSTIINSFISSNSTDFSFWNNKDSEFNDIFEIFTTRNLSDQDRMYLRNSEAYVGDSIWVNISPSYLRESEQWDMVFEKFTFAPIYNFSLSRLQLLAIAKVFFTIYVQSDEFVNADNSWKQDFLKSYNELMESDTDWAFSFDMKIIYDCHWDEMSQEDSIEHIDILYSWQSWIHRN